jgi:hypothetical protein
MDQLARSEQADDDAVAAQKELARSEQADDDAVAAQKAADDARNARAQAALDAAKKGGGSDTIASRKKP